MATDRPHRTAAVLAIGDELALGQTLDTNSRWIADRFAAAGLRVVEHATVGDDEAKIAEAIERLAAGVEALVVTGGLGPTADDLTRFALNRVLGGGELVLDEAALSAIRAWFASRGGMPEANAVQAMRPRAAVCLDNPHGTAPGLFARLEAGGCDIWCLPGPPREMQPMFDAAVSPRLRGDAGRVAGVRLVLSFGLGESAVAERLGDLMGRDRPTRGLPLVGTTASRGVVTCRVRHEADGASRLRAELDAVEADINERLRPAVFARRDPTSGDGMDIADALPETAVRLLTDRGEMVAVAESCSGGLLGAMLTSVPGSSAAFFGGWLSYANEAKTALVGVDPYLIASHGAVSRDVAVGLAEAALDRARDAEPRVAHALAITGIAGPGGGSDDKPVGNVHIAVASHDAPTDARRFVFKGGRAAIREWSARTAIGLLRLRLNGHDMPLLGQVEPRLTGA